MVLVDAHTVEAELLGIEELVYLAVVELTSELGVEEAVRTGDPCGPVVIRRESRVRHQMEAEYTHVGGLVCRALARLAGSGTSYGGKRSRARRGLRLLSGLRTVFPQCLFQVNVNMDVAPARETIPLALIS